MEKILGLDGVGEGPVAGPMFVGGFVTPDVLPEYWSELRDSKKLSEAKREALADKLQTDFPDNWALEVATNKKIDSMGFTACLTKLYSDLIFRLSPLLGEHFEVILDGNKSWGLPVTTLIKADDKIKEVSAASIIAKVTRDRYMVEMSNDYPEYGFAKNKGYLTSEHKDAIIKYGLCVLHRTSYKLKGI